MFVDLLLLLLLHFDVKICLDLCLVILIILKNDLLFSLHVMLMLLWQTQGIVVVVVFLVCKFWNMAELGVVISYYVGFVGIRNEVKTKSLGWFSLGNDIM